VLVPITGHTLFHHTPHPTADDDILSVEWDRRRTGRHFVNRRENTDESDLFEPG